MLKTPEQFLKDLEVYLSIQLKVNGESPESLLSPGIKYLAEEIIQKIQQFQAEQKQAQK